MAPTARPPGQVKLLLDVHHSPLVADRLSAEGGDVVAGAADPLLRPLSDEELLRAATSLGRTVVTENARDFDRIARAWAVAGEHHGGIVLTSPRRFHRGATAYPEDLTRALRALLASPPATTEDMVIWLGA